MRYDLFIANLSAYRLDQEALKLIHSYLCDRSENAKLGLSFSNELDIFCCVPQGSILGQLLFHIDMCDFLFTDMSLLP